MSYIKTCLTAFTFLALAFPYPAFAEDPAPDSLKKSTLISVDQKENAVHIYVEGELVLVVDEDGLRVKGKITEVESFDNEDGGKGDE